MNLLPNYGAQSQELTSDPFRAMRREMENALRAVDQNWPCRGHWGWRAGNQCGGN